LWSHKGPTLKGIRNWAPAGTQLLFPGLRSDTFWTGWYVPKIQLNVLCPFSLPYGNIPSRIPNQNSVCICFPSSELHVLDFFIYLFTVDLMTLSIAQIIWQWMTNWLMNDDVEGSSYSPIGALSWHFPAETKENHGNPQSVSQPKFKVCTFRIQVRSITTCASLPSDFNILTVKVKLSLHLTD
jgi:hypothetical protein